MKTTYYLTADLDLRPESERLEFVMDGRSLIPVLSPEFSVTSEFAVFELPSGRQ